MTETRTLLDGREVIITELTDRAASDPFRWGAQFPGEENVTGIGTCPHNAVEALLGHQKYLDAAYAAAAPQRRFRAWVEAGRPPLYADETARCGHYVNDPGTPDDPQVPEECGKLSRYIVERSDEDSSYGELDGGAEVCERHLADEVFLMMGGEETIRAVVTPRWDGPESEERP